jgi:hypothetical protein
MACTDLDGRVFPPRTGVVLASGTWGLILPLQRDVAPPFYAWLYSLDTLLPIIDLHQERFWEPKPEGLLGLASFFYLRLHITAGWFLSTLFAAGVVGLVRRIQ